MNQSESKTYNHLLKKGYKKAEINYVLNRTPAFKTFDGKTFDSKYCYDNLTVIFRGNERKLYQLNTQIMMFRINDKIPLKIAKWQDLENKDFYQGIKLLHGSIKKSTCVDLDTLDKEIKKSFKIYMAERGIESEKEAIEVILYEFFTLKEDKKK